MTAMENRRPIASRSSGWARRMATALARSGVPANAISVASVVFAAGAGAALLTTTTAGYLAALVLVPLRLLANLLDGMVAVEHGRATPTGPLYNEVPDRIADVLILAAAGAAAAGAARLGGGGLVAEWGATVGWCAAVAALLTAYVRELGRALGASADFGGPFAKQQRMWAVVAGAVLAAVEGAWSGAGEALFAVLLFTAAGTLWTVALRLRRLARHLRARSDPGVAD